MNGRLESELKIDNHINKRLLGSPYFLIGWNDYLKASGKTASTRNDFIGKVIKFLCFINPNINEFDLNDLTSAIVIKYFSVIQTTNSGGDISYTSDSYKQTVWSCLNNFFNYLYENKLIQENPLHCISRPKNKDASRIESKRTLLTSEDFQKILKSVENGVGSHKAREFQLYTRQRDICIMLMFMTTGMRKSALVSINVEDLDLENKSLTVIDKGRITHSYVLTDRLVEELEKWLNERRLFFNMPNNGPLFVSYQCNRISVKGIDKLVKKYTFDALGIGLSPHKLRAGLCSILYNETHDAEFTRKAIGHSHISTTLRYIVTDGNERKEASKIMESVLQ